MNHGLVTAGPDLASAVMFAVLLARACRAQLLAMAAGGPQTWSDEDEVVTKMASAWPTSQLHQGYDYLVRRGAVLHRASTA